MAGERPTWSSKKYKNYNEFRQAVLAWKKQQPDPKNPKVGDKKVIPRKRIGSKITPAHTVIWNGKKWVKKGDVSLVPDRVGKVDLNSKEYKRAKEINERTNKTVNKDNKDNNKEKVEKVEKKDNTEKVTEKKTEKVTEKTNEKPKDKLKIKTPKGYVRDKGRLYPIRSAQGQRLLNEQKRKKRAKDLYAKRQANKNK